jgi:hypothetical protein
MKTGQTIQNINLSNAYIQELTMKLIKIRSVNTRK